MTKIVITCFAHYYFVVVQQRDLFMYHLVEEASPACNEDQVVTSYPDLMYKSMAFPLFLSTYNPSLSHFHLRCTIRSALLMSPLATPLRLHVGDTMRLAMVGATSGGPISVAAFVTVDGGQCNMAISQNPIMFPVVISCAEIISCRNQQLSLGGTTSKLWCCQGCGSFDTSAACLIFRRKECFVDHKCCNTCCCARSSSSLC